MQGFHTDLEKETIKNEDFRRVLFTAKHSQLVLMSIESGEEIGLEAHDTHDQFIRVEKGEGKAIIGDDEFPLFDGSAIIVPAGSKHNVINTGDGKMKLYTVYSPAEHPDKTVHHTKAEADEYEKHHNE